MTEMTSLDTERVGERRGNARADDDTKFLEFFEDRDEETAGRFTGDIDEVTRKCFQGARGRVEAQYVGFWYTLLEKTLGEKVGGTVGWCASEYTSVGGGFKKLTDCFNNDNGFTSSRTRIQ